MLKMLNQYNKCKLDIEIMALSVIRIVIIVAVRCRLLREASIVLILRVFCKMKRPTRSLTCCLRQYCFLICVLLL